LKSFDDFLNILLRFPAPAAIEHAQTDKAEKGFDNSVNNSGKNMGYENLCQGCLLIYLTINDKTHILTMGFEFQSQGNEQ